MKQIILIILSFILITNSKSQIPIDSATMYLTGTFKKYNPQRAFQINLQNATNGNAKAMNAVAMQYTKGLGVDSNFNLAIYWFSQSATNGYSKALVNLGMLYKHKASDSAGYSIACNYFNQALQVNEPSAFFAQGYMFYKGLGCTQSYTNALNLFNQGIALNQSNCMYFKGLCYKFGYGVVPNADSANYYIDTAAKLGYKQANAELYNNNQNPTAARKSMTRNANNEQQETRNANSEKQETRNEFVPIAKTSKPITINGKYVGALHQYDYSGKKLIAQIPISLQVSTNNNIITGDLIFNNSQSVQLKAIQQGNQLIFSQTAFATSASLRSLRETKLVFKTATFNISHSFGGVGEADTNYLTGTLQLFNTYTHETDKPINIKLAQRNEKQETRNGIEQETRNVLVFPNPTKGTFNISFNLAKPSPVKINIHNQQGQVVYTKVFENLPKGKNQIPLNPPLEGREAGIYIIKVLSNQQQQTTAFIKE